MGFGWLGGGVMWEKGGYEGRGGRGWDALLMSEEGVVA